MAEPTSPLDEKVRKQVAELLKPSLLTMLDLHIHIHVGIWNIEGPRWWEFNQRAPCIKAKLHECIDQITGRIAQLGFTSPGNATEIEAGTRLKEWPSETTGGDEIFRMVADSLLVVIETLAEAVDAVREAGDAVSGHMLEHCQMQIEYVAGEFVASL